MTGKEFFSMRQWPFIIQNQCDILKTNVTSSDDDDTRSTICVESDSVTFVTGCLSDSGLGNV